MSGERKQTAGFCAPQKVRLLNKPDIFVDGKSKARAKVSWKQVSGAQKYEIYRSDSKNGQYKKLAVVKDYASFQDAGRTSGKTYFYKVRAVGTGIKGHTVHSVYRKVISKPDDMQKSGGRNGKRLLPAA